MNKKLISKCCHSEVSESVYFTCLKCGQVCEVIEIEEPQPIQKEEVNYMQVGKKLECGHCHPEMKIKTLYLLSHKMKWKTFKMLHDKLVNESGPVPMDDKMLWEMVRDKQIYCWFCEEMKNDMGVGLELPEYEELEIIA